METKGIEQSLLKPSKTAISKKSGAKYGALDDENDPDLAQIVRAWPTLPKHIQIKIKDLIEKHIMEGKADDSKKEKS